MPANDTKCSVPPVLTHTNFQRLLFDDAQKKRDRLRKLYPKSKPKPHPDQQILLPIFPNQE